MKADELSIKAGLTMRFQLISVLKLMIMGMIHGAFGH